MKKKLIKITSIIVAISLVMGGWSITGRSTIVTEAASAEGVPVSEIPHESDEENVVNKIKEEIAQEESDQHTIESMSSESDTVEGAGTEQNVFSTDALNDENVTATMEAEQLSIFSEGDGTESNPYQVSTAEQLNAVRNDLTAYYIQTADIDLSGSEWEPIGGQRYDEEEKQVFTGSYDGNGYEIRNMTLTTTGYLYVGLFGISTGTISNVNLVNCNINMPMDYAEDDRVCIGGVVGGNRYSSTKGNVYNCSAKGEIRLYNAFQVYVGGIVGYGGCSDSVNYTTINVEAIRNADYSLNSGRIMCGGIVGHSGSINTSISKCINYGDITASADTFLYCGGISGEYGAIEYCANYGNISGKIIAYHGWSSFAHNSNVGGIVGATSSDTNENCINFGNVSSKVEADGGTCSAGGYSGFIGHYSSGKISNCYNLCDTIEYTANTTTSRSRAGRVAGYFVSDRASECYSYDRTLINGEIPVEDIGADQINGANLSWDEINEAIESILSVLGLNTDESKFVIPDDEWSFQNYGVDKIPLTEDDYDALMYACGNNAVVKELLNSQIDPQLPWYEYLWEKFCKGHIINGQCYGIALSALLIKNNLLSLNSIQENIFTLYEAEKNENSMSVIGWNYLSQYLIRDNIIKEFEQLPTAKQLNNISNFNSNFLLCYGAENWGEHAVVGYGIEKGSWNYHGKTYDTRVLTYDSNTVYTASNVEDYYFYFNSGTDEWEVPHYYNRGVSSEKNGYLVLAYENVEDLNMDIEKWREEFRANKTTLITSNSEINLNTGTESLIISGGKYSGEDYYAYYEMGYNESSDNYSPKMIVEFDESPSFTISSGENDVLDYNCLFDDFYYQVLSDKFETVYFSETGEIAITGLEDEVGIALTANNSALSWNTVSILNNGASNISMKQTTDGILVDSDNLNDVIIFATNDEESQELPCSTNENSILISELDNELMVLIDIDNDGIYDTDINEKKDHTHTYGTPKFTWSEDYSSCSAVFTCTDGDDQQTVNCALSAKDNGNGTVTYTATAEFNNETYSDSKQIEKSDQSDVTDQQNGKPASDNSGSENRNDPGTDVSSDASSSESSAKTGDISHVGLWFILIVVGAGVTCLAIYQRKRNSLN